MTLWNSWNNCNNFVFCRKKDEACVVWDSFGVIIRDCDGFVFGGGGGFKDELMMTEWAKLYAFEECLKLAHSLNIDNAIFDTDCASFMNRFKKHKEDIIIIGHHIKEIYKTLEMFTTADVKWAN
ncbi:hypothetical protein Golob_021753 [Gossypium lobatum]|uniref:RNase H type-1 domain-containing protein n=1 Tax=Gossypium lobatum TaxID=34289 RepID=A0A7J8LEI3_9ROSI|nr:hypothetical protein [Gossypium lobatum]